MAPREGVSAVRSLFSSSGTAAGRRVPGAPHPLALSPVRSAFEELRTRLAETYDLGAAGAILGWDQQVMMPPNGASARAEQLATIGRIAHEKFVSAEVGRLLEQLEGFEAEHDYDSFEASLIRYTRVVYAKSCKVPAELRAEMARASALGLPVWVKARAEND